MAVAAPRLGAGMIYGMIGPLARDDGAHAVRRHVRAQVETSELANERLLAM